LSIAAAAGTQTLLDCLGLHAYSVAAMIGQFSYRYYYYGPLSARRDGWAMGCRDTE
jgi:hypothetical protein